MRQIIYFVFAEKDAKDYRGKGVKRLQKKSEKDGYSF